MTLSKAKTLDWLQQHIKSAKILDQICFNVSGWQKKQQDIINEIDKKKWLSKHLIIRSSALGEDSITSSMAGCFTSKLNIIGENNIIAAINDVIASYQDNNDNHEVFIQPMLTNVKISGVVFTYDVNNNAPYYHISYDNSSGLTDTVTHGLDNNIQDFYCHKNHQHQFDNFYDDVLALCRDCEAIMNNNALDIEFAIDNTDQLYLLQARPLIITNNNTSNNINQNNHYDIIQKIHARIRSWIMPHPFLYGDKGIYGIMPDWNPAEMIGIKPKPLALSLYKELITDSIWAYQRDNYGYCDLRSFPLMIEFNGMPYIDVRVSFNSFVPKTLDKKIAEKLVNYYLNKLRNEPYLHDKVEFDIVFSCYSFDINERIEVLKKYDFSQNDITKIKNALRDVTNNIIHHETGLWKKDLAKIDILQQRFDTVVNDNTLDDFAKIYWLIEDCKRYGTLPFAGLARAGFVAIELLKSLKTRNILDENDYNNFLTSLNTVSSHILEDLNHLKKEKFIEKYGHLRPSTYDITSQAYDDNIEDYFSYYYDTQKKQKNFALSLQQLNDINSFLKSNNFDIDALSLLNFIQQAIEAREYAKFMFTKNVDRILKLINKVANQYNINTNDCAFLDIHDVMTLHHAAKDIKKTLYESITQGKTNFNATKSINLPPLICDANDVFYFHDINARANFVTQKNISGDITVLNNYKDISLRDKIVLIESADPGYDWIFSHHIKGLITKYGGANSHMAIRSAELGIPAIIGAGNLYDKIKTRQSIFFDCLNQIIK